MEFESAAFAGKLPDPERLLSFGFRKEAGGLRFQTEIMGGDFLLSVFVRENRAVYTVTDRETGEDYAPLGVSGWNGSYVSKVRCACGEKLQEIADACFYDPASLRKKRSWIIPANLRYYDIVRAYRTRNETDWRQYRNVEAGDVVYIYVGVPYQAILYRCEVEEAHLPDQEYPYERMRMKITDRYDPGLFTRDAAMKRFGVTNVRGPRSMPEEFETYIRETAASSQGN